MPNGEVVKNVTPANWGKFLRYNYLKVNFTDVKEPGLYKIKYNTSVSPIFRIDNDVYARGVWQPVLEYFLPVQMCQHARQRKNTAYGTTAATWTMPRWHRHTIISTATTRKRACPSSNRVKWFPVNIGGWHDAGDFDLRIESQAGESYILALAYELSTRIST